MLDFVNKYGFNVHSQNSEDGIIAECVKRLALSKGYCVDIGCNDGLWLSNVRLLLENGWSGTLVDASWPLYLQCEKNWSHRKDVKTTCAKVDGHSVNFYVRDDCDLLSVDTDGADYEIFKGMQAKPGIVIVEIDSSIPPDADEFNSDGGAGYKPMVELARSKGYFLLCHTGNLVFIDGRYRALFPEVERGDPILNSDLYFNRSWLRAA